MYRQHYQNSVYESNEVFGCGPNHPVAGRGKQDPVRVLGLPGQPPGRATAGTGRPPACAQVVGGRPPPPPNMTDLVGLSWSAFVADFGSLKSEGLYLSIENDRE